MPTIDRDGVSIYYEDNGAGLPVLLTHGYAATTHMWRSQIAALSGDYRLIPWDMRGHGQSDSPEDESRYSREHTIEDIRAILDELGLERAVIAGHSLGGYMSLAFQAKYPERAQALILQGCGPGYRNPEARREWNESRLARADRLESEGLASHDGGVDFVVSEHRSAAGLARAARGMLTQHDSLVIDGLAAIAVPALLLVGEDDTPFRNGIDYMERGIANTEKHVFPGAGHAVNMEQPEAVTAAMRDFLAGLPAEAA